MHEKYGFFSVTFQAGDQLVSKALDAEVPADFWFKHGVWMWSCWSFFGWFMLATKRYFKPNWFVNQVIHSFLGTFITLATIYWFFKTIDFQHHLEYEIHTFLAFTVFGLGTLAWLTGAFGAASGRFKLFYKPWENHKNPATQALKAHSFISRANFIFGYLTCTTGLLGYAKHFGNENFAYARAHGLCLTTFFITVEVIFRRWRKRHDRTIKDHEKLPTMTIAEFKERAFDKG